MPGDLRLPLDVVRAIPHGHVADEIVRRIEEESAVALGATLRPARSEFLHKLARHSMYFPIFKGRPLLMVMMGTHRIPLNAADWHRAHEPRAAWLFDAWPNSYGDLRRFVALYGITHLFVTAKQSAHVLGGSMAECRVEWLPEPFIDLGFHPLPWSERGDTVIQFGRKYEAYHEALVAREDGAFEYVFERTKGDVAFPTTSEFVDALCRAKISVCFPSNVTHPERAGVVSTMTQRYLQSMAAGCVVVGSTPPEMVEVFGYDPVVQADMSNPVSQVKRILANPDDYLPLVERNLRELLLHTVAMRCETIRKSLV